MTDAEMAAMKSQQIAALSREPFGREFATLMWVEFQGRAAGGGFSYNDREYCGHALLRTADGVGIFDVRDGQPCAPLMEWKDPDSFIDFWSAQSDYGLCGEDPAFPRLQATTVYQLNSQRITYVRILQFLGWRFRMD